GAGPGPRRIARVIEQAIRRNYSVA
ncbi:MAG: hypothetical protein QOJ23_3491, partial [Actinomycetota bacterium]|nr:hypothetical protein [Actinomycetota bacterium]